jgi:hypothetical protein
LLKLKQDEIFKYQNGSTQPHIYSNILSKHFKIKIPKNKQSINDLEPLFQDIEILQMEMKEAESQYKQLIKELSEEAIPSNLINKQIEIKSDNETNKEVINESPEKKPKVSKSKKSINDDNKILESNIKNINDTNLMENQIEIKVKKSIKKKVNNTVVEL